MKASKPDFDRLVALAKAHDNVVTRGQLFAIGFTDKRIRGLVARQLWLQLQRGVYLIGAGPATWRQRARAAQYAGGDHLALDAGTSLLWWGVHGPEEGDIQLTLLDRSGGPQPHGAVIRQPSRPIKTQKRDGVTVVRIEDALLNFAALTADRQKVEIVVESALLSKQTSEHRRFGAWWDRTHGPASAASLCSEA